MTSLYRGRPNVKRHRVSPRPNAPFGLGLLSAPLPAEPTTDPMPPKRVRWAKLDLSPLPDDDGPCGEPEPILTLSGAWAMPGEDVHSWDLGHEG